MQNWSIDILRQGNWDIWTLLCVLAALSLGVYLIAGRVRQSSRRGLIVSLSLVGIGGTAAVLAFAALRNPLVGMGWTFILLSILSGVFYLNLRATISQRQMRVLLTLRIVALALLVPMLFEPVLRFVANPEPERPLIFVIDTSGSMSVPDVQNGPTRIQSVWQTLAPQLALIKSHFVPSFFTFSNETKQLKSADELTTVSPDGPSTDIVGALTRALSTASRPDASVVLISDGIDNTSSDVLGAVRTSQRPIHTISVGSDQAEPTTLVNIAVTDVRPKDELIVHHQTPLIATIQSTSLANRVVEVKLAELDEQGKTGEPIATAKLVLQSLVGGQEVELDYTPAKAGVQRLAVWVDPVPGERSVVDNRQEFQGLALDPRVKVLYVEGRARPEYRELRRAMERDLNIELATLLRIQQDRFSASGSVDGHPVEKLPDDDKGWGAFDVILLGDLDSSFLSRSQQQSIEKAVREGKGLLMIGGQTSLGPGGYQGTPIESVLPVFVGDRSVGQETQPFVPRLTAEGAVHPAMQGLADWLGTDTTKPTHSLPDLRGNVVVQKAKSGAQVLLVHPQRTGADGQPEIVLAVQRYGQGRAAALTVDTTYLWYLPLRGMGQDSPYNRFWGQLVRWLAGTDVKNRERGAGVDALLNKSVYQLGDSVTIRAMVRDELGDATRFAQVKATLKRDGQPDQEYDLKPVDSHVGLYEVTIPTPEKGKYGVIIRATKDKKNIGSHGLTFSVIPPADEMLKLAANPILLAGISDETHGFHYDLGGFPTLIKELVQRDPNSGKSVQKSVPLANTARVVLALVGVLPKWDSRYDLPMQGVLVGGLLIAEWILRRRWQLT